MRKFLLICAVLAPSVAIAAEQPKPEARVSRQDDAEIRSIQAQELQTLRAISAEIASMRGDIRCIRIRSSGGAC